VVVTVLRRSHLSTTSSLTIATRQPVARGGFAVYVKIEIVTAGVRSALNAARRGKVAQDLSICPPISWIFPDRVRKFYADFAAEAGRQHFRAVWIGCKRCSPARFDIGVYSAMILSQVITGAIAGGLNVTTVSNMEAAPDQSVTRCPACENRQHFRNFFQCRFCISRTSSFR